MALENRKDTGNYSHSAQFETQVYDGVLWVPLNALGKSRYTGEEMAEIVGLPLEEKKKRIGNLYEAVQLFHASGFKGVLDNQDFTIDGVHWQTHKAPKDAVLSNEGCCATDTHWLAYFIGDRYDFVGSFCYANTDGNGHITTYIRQDGFYYFLDMMLCRQDSQSAFCRENGSLSDLLAGEWAGFLYRCQNPLDFCRFHMEMCRRKGRDVPFAFYLREAEQATATGVQVYEDGAEFFVPKQDKPKIIWQKEGIRSAVRFVDLPKELL